jgi:exodeoxyribonuclease-3
VPSRVKTIKVATFNINGVRSRLPILLEWLKREAPDIACLQELKATDEAFPIDAIRDAGYGALWQGQSAWNGVAILARGMDPVESRRGLPGDPKDTQSRYLEAAAQGIIVGCLYLPNGNPQPGPKFDYKLAWFERFIRYAATLYRSGHPVILAGDYNVVPTDMDIYNPRSWLKDALLQPESRACYERLLAQGWTDALRARHPDERIYTFWDYFRKHWQRDAGLRIDHLLLSADLASRFKDAGVDRWVRDSPSPSDHAPAWIELKVGATTKKSATKKATVTKAASVPAKTRRPRAKNT